MTSRADAAPRAPRRFKAHHLSMMALGSAIGAGFFLGTGVAISEAGPAVLISYVLAALIAVSVMYSLAELAAALPSTGSFSTYAEAGIGRWAGFLAGWLYWFMLIMVLGLEITGAAQIFIGWFPQVPQWLVALVIVLVLGGINLMAAGDFGRVEAWLAGMKVAAIALFLVIAVLLIVGIVPGREQPINEVILGHGGFLPKGIGGIAVGLLAIITSFGGIEVITIATAEAEDAQRAMSRAIRSVIWRILVFYVGSVCLLICLLPWDSEEMRTNPFASVLDMAGIPAVGRIMEFIVFVALVSAFSANIYASSRMSYSLSARGMGARWLLGAGASAVSSSGAEGVHDVVAAEAQGDIAQGRTPKRAVSVSVVLALVSVALNWFLPSTLLGILINSVGMVLLIVWILIVVSQMRLRRSLEAAGTLTIRMPLWPYLSWVVLGALGVVLALMLTTESGRAQLLAMGGLSVVVVAIFFVREWWLARH